MKKRWRYPFGAILLVFVVMLFVINLQADINETPCLSLTFDDGLKSHYVTAYPMLKDRDLTGTFFVVADIDENPHEDLMTSAQIQTLIDDGFEIGSHTLTHPFLTRLSEEEADRELRESKKRIEEEYGISVESVAFPYGDRDKTIIDIAKNIYRNARAVYNDKPVGFFLDSFGLESDTNAEKICDYIDYAYEKDKWLVLTFHDIVEDPGKWDTSLDDFKTILDCAEASFIKVDTVRGCREFVS